MSRYHSDFLFSAPIDQKLFNDVHQYMKSEGYSFLMFEGENVYKKGNGFAAGPTFMKITTNGNYVIVEAWIKFAALPGVYAGEMGLSGAVGALPKSMLRSRVGIVEDMIRRYGGQQTFAGDIKEAVSQTGYAPTPAPVGNHTASAASYCASCGAALPEFAAFCQSCGAPVGQKKSYCPTCGHEATPNQSFCSRCGTKLK